MSEPKIPSTCSTGSESYLAEDVSVGQLLRWIDREHRNASRETPPNLDYMRSLMRLWKSVDHALTIYRLSDQPNTVKYRIMDVLNEGK